MEIQLDYEEAQDDAGQCCTNLREHEGEGCRSLIKMPAGLMAT